MGLHGKEWVKQNVHSKLLKGSIGQALDDLVRRGQDGQSLGIPLGPDTSIVVAEIIGSAVDRELESALTVNEEIAFRYTDDFFIGLRDGRSVETTLAAVASALSLFELEISSDKTRVVHAATRADPDWALEISQFRLPTERIRQRRALEYYFKKAFHLAQTNPSQNVLGYCISRSRTFDIDAENWSTYEEFILQSARANSMTIETAVRILIDGLRSGRTLNLTWISHFIGDTIKKSAPLDHHGEICWLLFLSRELGIELEDHLVQACENVENSVVGLLLLDLGSRDLAKVGEMKHRIARALTSKSLSSSEWLIAYEGARLGWLGDKATRLVQADKYFNTLLSLGIGFYDTKRTTHRIEKEKITTDPAYYDLSYFRF